MLFCYYYLHLLSHYLLLLCHLISFCSYSRCWCFFCLHSLAVNQSASLPVVRPSSSPSSVSLYFIYGFLDSKLFGFWLFFLSAEGILSILFLFLTKGSCFCNSAFLIFTCCNNHHGRRSVSPCKGLSVCPSALPNDWLGSSVFIGGRSKYNC